ncbi:MAG: hypothetical protein ACOX08_10950 [Methanobacterium sp.]|jgi:hypothetical protein|nr:hypothetical protein [Atribacterota bacterium]
MRVNGSAPPVLVFIIVVSVVMWTGVRRCSGLIVNSHNTAQTI